MTQKEFEKRVKEENLRMKDFSLEIGVLMEVEGYNKSSVPKHPKINITRYQDEKVRQRI